MVLTYLVATCGFIKGVVLGAAAAGAVAASRCAKHKLEARS